MWCLDDVVRMPATRLMSARSELARVHVVQLLTSFEKEMWSFFLCQLPTSENRLTFELTDCRLVYVLYPSFALPTSVNRRPTTLANTSTQNSKIYSRFSLFYDLSTKRLWKKQLACEKDLPSFQNSLNLMINLMTCKTFTKWEVCRFRNGFRRCGATVDRFRGRNVKFFSLLWNRGRRRGHRHPNVKIATEFSNLAYRLQYWRRVLRFSLPKILHLSFSPFEMRWVRTFHCQKRCTFRNSSHSSHCQMAWLTGDRSSCRESFPSSR